MTDHVEFEVCVPVDHPCLPGHFPGNPIVPGVLLLDAIVSHIEQVTGCKAWCLQQVKFLSVLRPGEAALANCVVSGDTVLFRASTRWGSAMAPLASGTIALATQRAQPAA